MHLSIFGIIFFSLIAIWFGIFIAFQFQKIRKALSRIKITYDTTLEDIVGGILFAIVFILIIMLIVIGAWSKNNKDAVYLKKDYDLHQVIKDCKNNGCIIKYKIYNKQYQETLSEEKYNEVEKVIVYTSIITGTTIAKLYVFADYDTPTIRERLRLEYEGE